MPLLLVASYLFKSGHLFRKVMPETPKYGLFLFINYRPLKLLINYQHGRFFFKQYNLGSKNNRN